MKSWGFGGKGSAVADDDSWYSSDDDASEPISRQSVRKTRPMTVHIRPQGESATQVPVADLTQAAAKLSLNPNCLAQFKVPEVITTSAPAADHPAVGKYTSSAVGNTVNPAARSIVANTAAPAFHHQHAISAANNSVSPGSFGQQEASITQHALQSTAHNGQWSAHTKTAFAATAGSAGPPSGPCAGVSAHPCQADPHAQLCTRVRIALLVLQKQPSRASNSLRLLQRIIDEQGNPAVSALLQEDVFRVVARDLPGFCSDSAAADEACALVLKVLKAVTLPTNGSAVAVQNLGCDVYTHVLLGLQSACRALLAPRAAPSLAACSLLQWGVEVMVKHEGPPKGPPEEHVALQDMCSLLKHADRVPQDALAWCMSGILVMAQAHILARQQLKGHAYREAVEAALQGVPPLRQQYGAIWNDLWSNSGAFSRSTTAKWHSVKPVSQNSLQSTLSAASGKSLCLPLQTAAVLNGSDKGHLALDKGPLSHEVEPVQMGLGPGPLANGLVAVRVVDSHSVSVDPSEESTSLSDSASQGGTAEVEEGQATFEGRVHAQVKHGSLRAALSKQLGRASEKAATKSAALADKGRQGLRKLQQGIAEALDSAPSLGLGDRQPAPSDGKRHAVNVASTAANCNATTDRQNPVSTSHGPTFAVNSNGRPSTAVPIVSSSAVPAAAALLARTQPTSGSIESAAAEPGATAGCVAAHADALALGALPDLIEWSSNERLEVVKQPPSQSVEQLVIQPGSQPVSSFKVPELQFQGREDNLWVAFPEQEPFSAPSAGPAPALPAASVRLHQLPAASVSLQQHAVLCPEQCSGHFPDSPLAVQRHAASASSYQGLSTTSTFSSCPFSAQPVPCTGLLSSWQAVPHSGPSPAAATAHLQSVSGVHPLVTHPSAPAVMMNSQRVSGQQPPPAIPDRRQPTSSTGLSHEVQPAMELASQRTCEGDAQQLRGAGLRNVLTTALSPRSNSWQRMKSNGVDTCSPGDGDAQAAAAGAVGQHLGGEVIRVEFGRSSPYTASPVTSPRMRSRSVIGMSGAITAACSALNGNAQADVGGADGQPSNGEVLRVEFGRSSPYVPSPVVCPRMRSRSVAGMPGSLASGQGFLSRGPESPARQPGSPASATGFLSGATGSPARYEVHMGRASPRACSPREVVSPHKDVSCPAAGNVANMVSACESPVNRVASVGMSVNSSPRESPATIAKTLSATVLMSR